MSRRVGSVMKPGKHLLIPWFIYLFIAQMRLHKAIIWLRKKLFEAISLSIQLNLYRKKVSATGAFSFGLKPEWLHLGMTFLSKF